MKYRVHNEPNWLYEAASCITEQDANNEEQVIENHNKFGMTREEMTDYFKKYMTYKRAVLEEIVPIFNRHPSLNWLFQKFELEMDDDFCLGLSIIAFWGNRARQDISKADIDELMTEYLISTISDYLADKSSEEIVIKSLSDLVDVLSGTIMDDALKMHMIKLYHTRYDTIKELVEMLLLCVPICQKHFHIIKEDFDNSIEVITKTDNLEELLDKAVGIRIKSHTDCNIYLTIFYFNRFRLEIRSNANNYYLGFYFLSLVDLKGKNRFNDNDMIVDLKALGDATRLKIIRILSEKKMYMQELAEVIGLTPATVSHHISILLKSDLISVTVGDDNARKVFYELNCSKLEKMANSIKSLAANRL